MKALLVVVIALLLVVGAIAGVLMVTASKPEPARANADSPGVASLGKQVALRPNVNCVFCHSDDGTIRMGPSFKGLYGSVVKYDDGSSGLLDEAAIRAALKNPNGKIVDGFEPKMPQDIDTKLSEDDRVNVLAYLRSIGAGK